MSSCLSLRVYKRRLGSAAIDPLNGFIESKARTFPSNQAPSGRNRKKVAYVDPCRAVILWSVSCGFHGLSCIAWAAKVAANIRNSD
jgi:hypothetical protein